MPGNSFGGTWYATLRRKSRKVRAGLKSSQSQANLVSAVGQAMLLWGIWGQGQQLTPPALRPGPSVVWRPGREGEGEAGEGRGQRSAGLRRSRSEMDVSRLQVGVGRGRWWGEREEGQAEGGRVVLCVVMSRAVV